MRLWTIFKLWLPIAIVTTAMCALVYIVVQQSLRQEANDPQIQLAEDTATALSNGQTIESVVPTTTVDMARSLAPFVMVYDGQGQVLASSGQLNGQPPRIPFGVLDNAMENGDDRVTWEPQNGVRLASVAVPYTTNAQVVGYVVVGRSLRMVEDRILQAQIYAGIVWAATLFATLVAVALGEFLFSGLGQSRAAAKAGG
jgi:sensor histidine kinase regulating citrate/malate metabolism